MIKSRYIARESAMECYCRQRKCYDSKECDIIMFLHLQYWQYFIFRPIFDDPIDESNIDEIQSTTDEICIHLCI